jgi:hypothetical protein
LERSERRPASRTDYIVSVRENKPRPAAVSHRRQPDYEFGLLDSGAGAVFRLSSCCVRKMLHQSLWSATGIPHSTQIRIRWRGWVFFANSLSKSDISSLL